MTADAVAVSSENAETVSEFPPVRSPWPHRSTASDC